MTNPTLPKHKGTVVTLGSRDFVLPPMAIATRKKDEASRQAMLQGASDLAEDAVLTMVVLETLQRNYPDLTVDTLEALASFEELLEVYIVLKEEEARRMVDLGKRMGALQQLALAQGVSTPSTTSLPPSSASSAEAGTSGSGSLTS